MLKWGTKGCNTVKKKRIGLCVFLLIVAVLCARFHFRVNPFLVERVVLLTYDHRDYGEVELTPQETWRLMSLYQHSLYAGTCDAEPCCDSYGFYIYYKDGRSRYVGQGVSKKMIEKSAPGEPYFILNHALVDYIYELAEKYELPIE